MSVVSHLKLLLLSRERGRHIRWELRGNGNGRHRLAIFSCHYLHLRGFHRESRDAGEHVVSDGETDGPNGMDRGMFMVAVDALGSVTMVTRVPVCLLRVLTSWFRLKLNDNWTPQLNIGRPIHLTACLWIDGEISRAPHRQGSRCTHYSGKTLTTIISGIEPGTSDM